MINTQNNKDEVKQEMTPPQRDVESADDIAKNASDKANAKRKDAD